MPTKAQLEAHIEELEARVLPDLPDQYAKVVQLLTEVVPNRRRFVIGTNRILAEATAVYLRELKRVSRRGLLN